MNNLILFIGGSGTGKTTTERELVESGFAKSIVSHTTRAKRDGEKEGVHYFFTDVETLKNLDRANEIEISDTWYYAVSKTELLKDYQNLIYSVINIKPAVDIINYVKDNKLNLNIIVVFFDVPKDFRIEQMKKRGEAEESILIRLNREDCLKDFEKYGISPDYIESVMDENMVKRVKDFICENMKK